MKGFKTLLFNIAMMAVTEGAHLVPMKYSVWIITIGNIILRAFTNTAIGRKE